MNNIDKLFDCKGFDWNPGNIEKNWLKHKVSPVECEQVFFNEPLIILDDPKHSAMEYAAFGHTDTGRLLVVIFTKRKMLLRAISARNMNHRERKFYEENK
jgi:uncharacterized DUF497 family protein